jgi:uridylate kinase
MRYKRVLLKLSGEFLKGESENSFDEEILARVAREVKVLNDRGIELLLVVGGGNIFRHATHAKERMDRVTADYMGMMATMINGLALQDAFETSGLKTRVMSAIEAKKVAEPFIPRRAKRHAEKGRVVILAAGTGNPFFTTDSAAVLRAVELDCDVVLKGTKVDGIYSGNPEHDPAATKYSHISYQEAIDKKLKVMDTTAFTLAEENSLPIVVFDILTEGNLLKIVQGQGIGTLVR